MRYKLIVAESSPSIQKAIQLAFPESEFEIFPFEDGTDVMKNLSKIVPDAILLSLSIPGKDVYEVGFYLKSHKEFRNTSIVFLRGVFEPLDQQKIASIDYDEIIQKPFDSGKLAQTVKNIIERKRNPLTLPEEPIVEDMTSEENDTEIQKDTEKSLKQSSELKSYETFVEEIQDFITQHIGKVESEMEERMKKRIFQELKELFQREIDELKVKISELNSSSGVRPYHKRKPG